MVDISGADKSKNQDWILEKAATMLEKLKDEVSSNPSSISSDELTDIISALEDSNDAIEDIKGLKDMTAVPISPRAVNRILSAAQFFEFVTIDKPTQERIGAVIISLFNEIKDQSQRLNENLRDAPHLKRGDKVKNIDPQDAR